jgi:Chemoreceptor zinc-binding domain/CheW-like domain
MNDESMLRTLLQPVCKYMQEWSYLVFTVNGQLYALPHQNIISILDKPQTTVIPGMVDEVSGVIDFMGKPLPLYDFRKIIGLRPLMEEADELASSLMQRKQDHLNWITKLKEAVTAGADITVETDPHKCAFGRWYDSFHSDNRIMERHLKQFDAPHKYIHGIALQAKQYMSDGDGDAALKLIQETEHNDLAKLVSLFDGTRQLLHRALTECVIVVQVGRAERVAFTVDEPSYFGQLDEITYPLPLMAVPQGAGFIEAHGVLNADGGASQVLIVALDKVIRRSCPVDKAIPLILQ